MRKSTKCDDPKGQFLATIHSANDVLNMEYDWSSNDLHCAHLSLIGYMSHGTLHKLFFRVKIGVIMKKVCQSVSHASENALIRMESSRNSSTFHQKTTSGCIFNFKLGVADWLGTGADLASSADLPTTRFPCCSSAYINILGRRSSFILTMCRQPTKRLSFIQDAFDATTFRPM